uniref:Uncharacterized protein n=1 Tax=Arundo donax TaxID=35708 RepID=A0A0A8YAB3_ARUDO
MASFTAGWRGCCKGGGLEWPAWQDP